MSIRAIFTLLTVFFQLTVFCQAFTGEHYYLFPINPGQQNFLAGTMGELRSSHFHAGLDIKTGGQTGLPVYASADGFISRIKVATGGYGNALYIDHPNNTTTVYAHLDRYETTIDQYVLAKQYEQEVFEIDLFPTRNEIPVKRGELIGFSGNTGSSSGPHLHYEIRDSEQRMLDPLMFGFTEIKDHISPILKSITFVSLDETGRINGYFGKFTFDVAKKEGKYHILTPISLSGNVGIEMYGYDLLDGTYSKNGIMQTYLVVDNDTIFSENKSRLSFSKQRNILVHMDYQIYKNGGSKFNKLFIDDGNTGDFYSYYNGKYHFSDTVHLITISLQDSYGNLSTFENPINNRTVYNPKMDFKNGDIIHNFLPIRSTSIDSFVTLYAGNQEIKLAPYYQNSSRNYFLHDLRNVIPDSIRAGSELIKPNILRMIPSGAETHFHVETADVSFFHYSLFDTLYLNYNYELHPKYQWELFRFDGVEIPLKSSVEIVLKPKQNYDHERTSVYGVSGDRLSYVGGKWNNQSISFRSTELGNYTIAKDSIPPFIQPTIINKSNLYFKITDDLSGIKGYRATLNGKFILMKYETKKDLIWSETFPPNNLIVGEFILEVEDNAGNKSTYKKNL